MQRQDIRKKIFVGLSGGVDSAVSAALLKKDGHDVTGVFIKVWQPDWIECNWKEERLEAMRVAAHLDIPFITLDLEKKYKEGVIDYMIAEYRAGRTPNPDVMCNREVKFGAFWQWAKKRGADAIATGHYARVAGSTKLEGRSSEKMSNTRAPSSNQQIRHWAQLRASKDLNKDQSYFLWTLDQADLAHVLFPVGHLPKPEVRKLALKFKLPNADKKDSQGLCFIGKLDVKEFLSHYIESKEGDVLNESGEKIGTHPGALLFTIGERHGFTVTRKTPNDAPYYVTRKDVERNTITVKNTKRNQDSGLEVQEGITNNRCVISRTNWISVTPKEGESFQARSRYRQPLQEVRIIRVDTNNSRAEIEFIQKQETLTPGQSLVMYNNEECIGGGIIEE